LFRRVEEDREGECSTANSNSKLPREVVVAIATAIVRPTPVATTKHTTNLLVKNASKAKNEEEKILLMDIMISFLGTAS
jgi:hypothetical protein